MSIRIGNSSGGKGGVTVADDNIFPSNSARDSYFTTNPSKLITNLQVSVAGQLQEYRNGVWVDISTIVTGPKGDNAPPLKIEYSSTGIDGWHEIFNTSLDKFWRWSTDGGVTWSPDGVRLTPQTVSGIPTPYQFTTQPTGELRISDVDTNLMEIGDNVFTYKDKPVYHEAALDILVDDINALTGASRIDASAIKDFPIATETELGMVKGSFTIEIKPDGSLESKVAAATKIVVPDQTAMLALPPITNLYIATRTDVNKIFYLNANQDPSILANWEEGASTQDTVTGFKGAGDISARTGEIVVSDTDYTADMVKATDNVTGRKYVLAVVNGVAGVREVA